MNLQSEIAPELWTAVSKSYGAADYTNSITDAVRHLFDVIRDKAGIELDGAQLIGHAFSGDAPVLQLNKLQTESEKMEQKGFQDILRGIYSGIRNPRSHEKLTDTQETADAIIFFVNYLLSVIDKAKQPFTVEGWIERVYDPFFVESKEYAEELVREIPARKRYETLITLYRKRDIDKIDASRYIFSAFYSVLGEAQIKEFLKVVSGELRIIQSKSDIKFHFVILRPEFWPDIDKAARMRIEGLIFKEIEQGTCALQVQFDESEESYYEEYVCTEGWLAIWTINYIPHFFNKDQITAKLLRKLRHFDEDHCNYVAEYFFQDLPNIVGENEVRFFIGTICNQVIKSNGEGLLANKVERTLIGLPDWREPIENLLKEKNMDVYKRLFEDTDIPF